MAFSELSQPWRSAPHSNPAGGLLLCHGFTGTPHAVRPWAEDHAAHGWDVRAPLLPGHGSTWQEMSASTWQDWYRSVRESALELQREHGTIAVGGISMGGTLAAALAEDPAVAPRIGALVLVNAAMVDSPVWAVAPALSRLVPSIGAIAGDIRREGVIEEAYDRTPLHAVGELRALVRRTRAGLGRITAPALVAVSPQDRTVPPRSSDVIASRTAGPVERMTLGASGHLATLDHDAEDLFARSRAHLGRWVPTSTEEGR
ncbi:carboxylesterase [Brachybacterium sp. ACRRE]|uniref:alpha/beta hydrolase n=1 Tax=Brachybacterium sp. ACRRE TaxID=2918184 RepID=UPI001EF29B9C|nr:alpha/beta fold hydrolase [Brachybacterium sp. ACRRE]MCG7308974.1 alpha/beta fold hydrolase [Brachybacterium sp. ACRRE]